MKFGTLSITNFLTVSDANVSLSDRGLCLVQGVNKDDTSAESNGAGKSSVFDALCWCLFNETARGVSGDEVINWDAAKGTRVSVDIHDGDDHWVVARHRKHKTGKNRLTLHFVDKAGAERDETAGTDKLTQDKVQKLVGASLDVFKASIYAGQDQMPDLPAMTDKSLKLVVEEAAGVTVIEDALTLARARLQTRKQIKATNETAHASNVRQLENAKDALAFDTKDEIEWEGQRKARVAAVVTDAKKLKVELDDSIKLRGAIDYAALVNELAAEQAKIDGVKGEQDELARLERELSVATSQTNMHRVDAQRIRDTFENQKKVLESVEHQVGCPCSACGRPITEAEIAITKKVETDRLDAMRRNFATTKTAFEATQELTQKLTGERDTFKASMTDLSSAIALVSSLAGKKRDTEALDRSIAQMTQAVQRQVDEAKRIAAEQNPHAGKIERAKTSIAALETRVEEYAELLKADEEAIAVAESVVQVFGPAGVRAHILDEVTPFLNKQTAVYLGVLSDGNIEATWTTLTAGARGELKEKFSIEVENRNGAKTFAGQSGGEKRKVRLAAALALQDLVARRAAKPIELFIGDEIDNALDAPGLERLTAVLEEKAKERGSVFVISHSDLKDWVSQVMTVTKQGGKTTIKEELV